MYKDLIVWQKSYEFTLEIYKVTKDYPNDEKFGLVSQMRRAASSIPANIAEGNMRKSPNEYKQFLYIARGSLAEMEVWSQLSLDLGYIDQLVYKSLNDKCIELGRLLNGLLKSL